MNDFTSPPNLEKIRSAQASLKAKKWHSVILELKTITPMVGGGTVAGEPDLLLPFRPRAIKNSLRHWWWLINRQKAQYKAEKGSELLYEEMTAIWGGAAEVNKESKSSNIRINVISTPLSDQQIVKSTEYRELAYALWMTVQGQDKQLGWTLVKPGYEFSLSIQINKGLSKEQIAGVWCAINAWLHFGGLGARTTRGLGKLMLFSCSGDLAHHAKRIFSTNDCWYQSFKQIVPQPPQIRICDENLTALQALGRSVSIYKTFRQARQNGKDKNDGKIKRLNRSYWPKADVIRFKYKAENVKGYKQHLRHTPHTGINGSKLPVPEILFGAPIKYKFPASETIPEGAISFKLNELKLERYVSPLILTVLRISDENYCPAALIFPFWSDVVDKGVGIPNVKTISPGVWWPNTNANDGKVRASMILAGEVMQPAKLFGDATSDPLREALIQAASNYGNPLASFLKFFSKWNAQVK